MAIQLEVDDAGNRVCAVHRRSAAGEDVNLLDQFSRNLVQISRAAAAWIAGAETTTVDEDERTLGAQATQVQGGGAVGTVGDVRVLARKHLRQGVHEIFDAGRAARLDFFGSHGDDGADRKFVRHRDTRTGDNDVLETGGRHLRRFLLRLRDSRCGNGTTSQRETHGRLQSSIAAIRHNRTTPVMKGTDSSVFTGELLSTPCDRPV